jgi:hypothetical protein
LEIGMNKFLRLAVIGIAGLAGVSFYARASLCGYLCSMGLRHVSASEEAVAEANAGYESVLLTEWLAGDVFSSSWLPVWSRSEGKTAETMHAYAELHEARQDSDALLDEHKRSLKHLEAKEHVFQELISRKIRLVEAATSWLDLDRSYGGDKVEHIARIYPGKTMTERYCRRLIWELEITAHQDPGRCGSALDQARKDLRLMTESGRLVTAN